MLHKMFSRKPTVVRILGGPFKGANLFLNPANSRRKILGLYERVLNEWIVEKVAGKDFVFDVGANTGYDTYGFAHLLLKQNIPHPLIVAFEPESFPELETPLGWAEYSRCEIRLVRKYAGRKTVDNSVTLDDAYDSFVDDDNRRGLIKIDIEGAEVDALFGASKLLSDKKHDWLIEIHGKELIPLVAKFFVENDRPFLIKDLPPLPILGAEQRTLYTTWLVTI